MVPLGYKLHVTKFSSKGLPKKVMKEKKLFLFLVVFVVVFDLLAVRNRVEKLKYFVS